MVWYSDAIWILDRPTNHLNTRQMDAILFSNVLVQFSYKSFAQGWTVKYSQVQRNLEQLSTSQVDFMKSYSESIHRTLWAFNIEILDIVWVS